MERNLADLDCGAVLRASSRQKCNANEIHDDEEEDLSLPSGAVGV